MKTIFETETCSRCHGTGKHSFCETYRDTCFKCHGSGITLTKRGYAAQQFFISLCTVPIDQVRVGDVIKVNSMTHGGGSYSYRAAVIEISVQNDAMTSITNGVSTTYNMITLTTEHPKYGKSSIGMAHIGTVRVYRPDDDERAKRALEYQETLTKAGTVRKSKKKAGVA